MNKLESSVSAKVYSSGRLENIKLFQQDIYRENSELSNAKLISKIIINELQSWWKDQISLIDFGSQEEFVFFIKIESKDLRKSIYIENRIVEILGNESFQLFEFDNNQMIYKVKTRYNTQQLNVLLEAENLKLTDLPSDDKYYLLQSY